MLLNNRLPVIILKSTQPCPADYSCPCSMLLNFLCSSSGISCAILLKTRILNLSKCSALEQMLLNFSGDLCHHLLKQAQYRQHMPSSTGLWDSYSCSLHPILQRKSKDAKKRKKWGGLGKPRENPSPHS